MKRTLIAEYEGHFGPFFQKDAQRSVELFKETVVVEGIPRWLRNSQVPPQDLLELWDHVGKEFDIFLATLARMQETSASIEAYKQRNANRVYSEEERYEMASAFGKDATIVDVITGKEIRL